MKRRMWIAVVLVAVTAAALCMVSFAHCVTSGQECGGLPTCDGYLQYCREGLACPPDYEVEWEYCGCC